jgi:hypothetical protein
MVSVALDCALNFWFIKNSKCKIVINNMFAGFVLINVILNAILVPMTYQVSSEPDDEFNTTYDQMSVNLLDSFAIIAFTTANIVLNRLFEQILQGMLLRKTLYVNEVLDITGAANPSAALWKRKLLDRFELKMTKVIEAEVESQNPLTEADVKGLSELLKKSVDEFDFSTSTGILRSILRFKMILNLLSTVTFLFYSSVYLSATSGCYIFTLFLTVLSLLNNGTSAACILKHDKIVKKIYHDPKIKLRFELGSYVGMHHAQYYGTILLNLITLGFHLTTTSAKVE